MYLNRAEVCWERANRPKSTLYCCRSCGSPYPSLFFKKKDPSLFFKKKAHNLATRLESSSLHLGVSPVINRTNLRRFGSILILTAKVRAFPKKAKIKASLGQLGLVTVLD